MLAPSPSRKRSCSDSKVALAAFIPLLLMGGMVGRFFREFSVTLVFAIAVSTIVSLSVTPMICAHFLTRAKEQAGPPGWGARLSTRMSDAYRRSLYASLRHPVMMILLLVLGAKLLGQGVGALGG